MTRVFCTITIDVPAEAVWLLLSDFGAACQYLFQVIDCRVEGSGIGARRTLTSTDGSTIVEQLNSLDELNHRLSYTLLSDTPFGNCVTTLAVFDLGSNQSQLDWSATFEADGIPTNEAEEILAGSMSANCLALKQFLER